MMQSDDESKAKNPAPETVQFQTVEIGDTFHRMYAGRFLTYRKTSKHHATVIHDPRAQLVGVCEPIGWILEVFPGPSPALQPDSEEAKAAEKAIHEGRRAKLEEQLAYWDDQYDKKPDMIAGAMQSNIRDAIYATNRILDVLHKPESRVAAKPSGE